MGRGVLGIEGPQSFLEPLGILLNAFSRRGPQELPERVVGEQQPQVEPQQSVEAFHLHGLEGHGISNIARLLQIGGNPLQVEAVLAEPGVAVDERSRQRPGYA